MAKEYRLEDDLMKKSRPRFGSARYNRLMSALHSQPYKGPRWPICENCKKMLFNPQSILIHQGRGCQKQIESKPQQ